MFYCPKGTFVALLMYFTLKTHWITELSSEMWALSCQSHEAHIPSCILEHRSEPSSVYPNLSLLHISPWLLEKGAKGKSLWQKQAMQALCLCFFFKKHQKTQQNHGSVATWVFQAAPVACKPREALGQEQAGLVGGTARPRQRYYRRPIIVFSPSRIWKRNQCG